MIGANGLFVGGGGAGVVEMLLQVLTLVVEEQSGYSNGSVSDNISTTRSVTLQVCFASIRLISVHDMILLNRIIWFN